MFQTGAIIRLLFNLYPDRALLKSGIMNIFFLSPLFFFSILIRAFLGLTLVLSSFVHAQLLPQSELNVVGGLSTRPTYSEVEKPFWTHSLSARSAGSVTAQIKGFDEMGLKGRELMRLMSQGIIEFGVLPLSYDAPETPLFEAVDIAGLAPSLSVAKETVNAFSPVLSHYLSSRQIKLLGAAPYGSQMLFCNVEIKGLSDLRGQTIRTITRTQSELLEALGAKSVNIPFSEVLNALDKKTINCAVAGPLTGYNAKWYTASTHLYALPLGWNLEVHAFNQKSWDKLSGPTQSFIEANVEQLIQNLWDFSEALTKRGIDCNTGNKECASVPRGQMKLVIPTPADLATVKRVADQKVLSAWAERCSDACVADYNQTIGKVIKSSARR